MLLKYLESVWVAVTFAEAGEYDALKEIMNTEEHGCECAGIHPVSETL